MESAARSAADFGAPGPCPGTFVVGIFVVGGFVAGVVFAGTTVSGGVLTGRLTGRL